MDLAVAHAQVRGHIALRQVRVFLKELQDPEAQVFAVLGMFARHGGRGNAPCGARPKPFKSEQCSSACASQQRACKRMRAFPNSKRVTVALLFCSLMSR